MTRAAALLTIFTLTACAAHSDSEADNSESAIRGTPEQAAAAAAVERARDFGVLYAQADNAAVTATTSPYLPPAMQNAYATMMEPAPDPSACVKSIGAWVFQPAGPRKYYLLSVDLPLNDARRIDVRVLVFSQGGELLFAGHAAAEGTQLALVFVPVDTTSNPRPPEWVKPLRCAN
jgi:hypothetical protein